MITLIFMTDGQSKKEVTNEQETAAQPVKTLPPKRSFSKWLKRFFFGKRNIDAFNLTKEQTDKITTLEEAKLYMEVAEKQLQDSVETGQIITERATNMLNLTSGLLIALVAYCIDKWETNFQQVTPLLKMAFWGCGALALMSGLLVVAILPKEYCVPGWQPKKILESGNFKNNADANDRQKYLCFNLLKTYQNNIDENNGLNKKRWALFKCAMFLILITPICFAAYYLFFR